MTRLREYKFEVCWLLLLVLLCAWSPAEPAAEWWNQDDESPSQCPETNGWCPEQI